ncbi:MAG: S-adenosylmethionine:tRNA ribosyltransferase-isomerase [Parcubacteria group bacterium LiPW_15]|nr:MAG: S-adenosylmethionine:tRNA ribosyltransferase-isomerase [Parcubacteria group bacterium LiPW_15]
MSLESVLKKYDYKFPSEAVANKPAHPRDSAKLLVYDRKTKAVNFDTFKNLGKYLPVGSVLVLNDTKVLPARLPLKKETGGVVKILYLETVGKNIKALSPKKLKVGEKLLLPDGKYFVITDVQDGEYLLRPSFNAREIYSVLKKYGETPLPPYIKNVPLTEKKIREEYQTVFAKVLGSVAAPTASLHFTKGLLNSLKKEGVKIVYVTLHVGLGTFAPLTEENLKTGKLHEEYYEISPKAASALNDAKKNGKRIIPVGTTALRTLESASVGGKLKKLFGETELFIKEGDRLKFSDGLITNFHVPRSSLLMLVSALLGHKKLFELYRLAIEKKFRLFSFGDGMLIK